MNQDLTIDEGITTDGGQNTMEYYSGLSTVLGLYIDENLFVADNISKYKINSDMYGISLQGYAFGLDMYTEYVLNKYTKLESGMETGEKTTGSQLYSSLYFDILNAGITYEFKRYDMPYFISTVSSAPIVYKEATSVLMSRMTHNMNFVNEIGHQFDINYLFNENLFLNINLSTARRIHPMDELHNSIDMSVDSLGMVDLHNEGPNAVLPSINQHWEENVSSLLREIGETPNFMSIIFMDKDAIVFSHNPYRQFFIVINLILVLDMIYLII
jgi:hypothetical protein